ncbi:DUF4240 domain-containing protein [Actinomadura nitritigenes]|uniref:DUF4240 domain-containing protein n=1 Tax=Actinomadura nitritigenes TaxID=134602 RepID=UPI003D921D17
MTEDEFWDLVERSRGHSPAPGRRLAWLEERLVRLPPAEFPRLSALFPARAGG